MWFASRKTEDTLLRRATPDVLEIRMEAIGGQGANSAGKILAEAAVLGMSFTGSHFSSYGSEKRGSPVRSFVRYSPSRKTIRSVAVIRKPHVLVVFHENLLASHPEILEGAGPETDLILNSTRSPGQVRLPDGIAPRQVATVDATGIALKFNCGLNAAMLGATSLFVSEIDADTLERTLDKFFSKLSEKIRLGNHAGFRQARAKVEFASYQPGPSIAVSPPRHLPRLGYANAPIGGLITNPGNTVIKDNSASRKGLAPRLLKELCFDCGFCDMVCPDFCFVWKATPGEKLPAALVGIDYQYCKGCGKCVEACPVEALVQVNESDIPAAEREARRFDLKPKGE